MIKQIYVPETAIITQSNYNLAIKQGILFQIVTKSPKKSVANYFNYCFSDFSSSSFLEKEVKEKI